MRPSLLLDAGGGVKRKLLWKMHSALLNSLRWRVSGKIFARYIPIYYMYFSRIFPREIWHNGAFLTRFCVVLVCASFFFYLLLSSGICMCQDLFNSPKRDLNHQNLTKVNVMGTEPVILHISAERFAWKGCADVMKLSRINLSCAMWKFR